MPFDGDRPKPLVLVGRNGSGKTTVMSFIINALIGMKQRVFEDAEVENGKVYRLRSALSINGDDEFFFARLNFDKGFSLIEWQLNAKKSDLKRPEAEFFSVDESWGRIPSNETNFYDLPLGEFADLSMLENMLNTTTFLFFPADRFEPPDWLNSESLSSELKLLEPSRMKGRTNRRILSKNRLKPTLDWVNSVVFDIMMAEHTPIQLPIAGGRGLSSLQVRMPVPGKAHAVFAAVVSVLKLVLCDEEQDQVELQIGSRKGRIISASVIRQGAVIRRIKDLTSLSAGESALFCLFASIISDADLSAMEFSNTNEISGIVIIDEADLHLHIGLQFDVLPRLMALFPKIQFVMSAHAPMVALGLEKILGEGGFEIREMPGNTHITSESYSEFLTAYDIFYSSKKFQQEAMAAISASESPILLVEGKTDARLLTTAWEKLNPGWPIPFLVVPCGIHPDAAQRTGGAGVLRQCIEHLAVVTDRPMIAVFDNDKAGNDNFKGLNKAVFNADGDDFHKKHVARNAHAILLPVPPGREKFVSLNNPSKRHLSIEHYFTDEILLRQGFSLEPLVPDSAVFEIEASSEVKVRFTETANTLGSEEFTNFSLIFSRLQDFGILRQEHTDASDSEAPAQEPTPETEVPAL